jgi:hypothetical protein
MRASSNTHRAAIVEGNATASSTSIDGVFEPPLLSWGTRETRRDPPGSPFSEMAIIRDAAPAMISSRRRRTRSVLS